MAKHKQCPPLNEVSAPILGNPLQAVRCQMILENRCKGDGIATGSLQEYCVMCSEYYGLCQECGKPFTPDQPRDGFPLIVLHPQPSGRIVATSPLIPEFLTEGDSVEEILGNCFDAFRELIARYAYREKQMPNVPQ